MQYLIQKKFPTDIANLISEYLPAHPMKKDLIDWRRNDAHLKVSRKNHFHKWYFMRYESDLTKIKDKLSRKYKDDKYWFKCMNEDGYTNEQAIKLRYKSKLEKAELIEELTALNLKLYQVRQVCHFGTFNRYGRMMEVYYKDKQIIF